MGGGRAIERRIQDLRYGFRALRSRPGFTAVAIGTLALGIGVNTAMFSVLEAVLLRQPPYQDPGRLVTLRQAFPRAGDLALGASPAEFLDYRDRTRAFSSVAGFESARFDLTGGGAPQRVAAARVTHTLFATLGVAAVAGRTFTESEDRWGGPKVAVLSDALWQARFAGRADAIGRTVTLDEQPYTIVGVMPAGFEFPLLPTSVGEPPALWVPMAFTPKELSERAAEFPVGVVARRRPEVSLAQAMADVRRVAEAFQRDHPDIYSGNLRLQADVDPLGARAAARSRPVLLTLAGGVLFVLLIACANVTSLLLARASVRAREIAVRHALGASAGRLRAQLLTESVLLTALGGLLGCGLAQGVIRLVVALWPAAPKGLAEARLDLGVLGFTLAISVAAGILCGLAPALTAGRPDVAATLRPAGRAGGSSRTRRVHSGLVVAETAAAALLLVGASLLLHSLVQVLRVEPGFAPEGAIVARTTFNRQRYPSGDRRREVEQETARRLAALPGVTAVGVTTHVPLADERQIGFILEGEDERSARWADNALVSGDYFAAMGIALRAGRTFGPEDGPRAPGACIVNESMARQLWPGQDALGRRLLWGGRLLTIVGVAADVHVQSLDTAVNPTIYSPLYQTESGATVSAVFVLRTRLAPAALAPAVRAAIGAIDPDVPVFDIRPLTDIVSRSLGTRTFAVAMLSLFALLALALAVIGTYGVLSYAVARRTPELGVRMALGAAPAGLRGLVLRDALRLAGMGAAAGLLLAAAAARALSALLFGVRPWDLATYAGAGTVLVLAALAASALPAARAARVDPMAALRSE